MAKKKKVIKKNPKKKTAKMPRKVLIKKKIANKKFKKNTKKFALKKPKKIRLKKIVLKKRVLTKKKIIKAKSSTLPSVGQSQQNGNFIAKSFFKAKIKVIGIGGGGGSIVSEIGRSLNKATFVVADTDMRSFKKRAGVKHFLFGQNLTHGLGTGVNPDLGKEAAMAEKERIARFFDDQDIIIFIASLGGGLGSGATQVFVDAAKDFDGITLGIFTLPFKFEGKNKYAIAQKSLKELRKSLNVSITIPNERIFKIIDANTAITDAFSMVNKSLIESLESLIDLIYSPGIINIDFADLKVILKGKGNFAFLNTAEAQGKTRAEDVSSKILHNSLYQNNNFITQKILFNIEGGANLSMFEVDKISKAISLVNPDAKIIFGISKNPKYKNKIKTTLLMTGQSLEDVRAGKKAKEARVVVLENIKKAAVKTKKSDKKNSKRPSPSPQKSPEYEKIPFDNVMSPAFQEQFSRLSIVEGQAKPKKAIRRTALDIKKAEEVEQNKQSLQEKEWEIPAFMRLKK
ncbi:MAG: hypothetical protein A2908_02490 [Candidatus Staskawiczbacteria bacterium RIFCSPLOWO2_01_FULL_38_12b]|uniref:Cell division protein FtsZ n=1 Tax=Candidatus Staskawiczbacteria bacterium RIFCSPLOWO2_01_FULL_38_12b TaxID=1802214 RepID=A0A1G2IBD4_9BACT|nr:MAG: hypothetical protein A2908_02490 [Candidatus Staskawiczbacteria bacterium RIFCSPLOWO2_01_FULL_38_12b]